MLDDKMDNIVVKSFSKKDNTQVVHVEEFVFNEKSKMTKASTEVKKSIIN